MLEKIKYDIKSRKDFLLLNRDVVKAWTTEIIGNKVIYGFSDEFSVALLAFNEAIDRFSGSGDFYKYAREQVKQRIYLTCEATKKVAKNI